MLARWWRAFIPIASPRSGCDFHVRARQVSYTLSVSQPRREHHYLPKLYLKGFIEPNSRYFIWEYERGRRYEPGLNRRRHSPRRVGVVSAGARRDGYAYVAFDGTEHIDSVEKSLEALEKPANPIFGAIRRQRRIGSSEKIVFAEYIGYMWKRVPAREERISAHWPNFIKSEEPWNEARAELKRRGFTNVEEMLKPFREYFEDEAAIPREIALKSILQPMPLFVGGLAQMTWRFLVAERGSAFATCDNPVVFRRATVLADPDAVLIFPISSKVALSASWRVAADRGYFALNRAGV